MPDTTDKPGSNDEQQDALVKSLESIKELLAKSESKLNAARDSLSKTNPMPMNKAKPSASPTSASKTVKGKIPVSSDPVVPVLDDIVEAEVNEPQLDISAIEVVGEELHQEVSEPSGEIPVFEFGAATKISGSEIDTDAVQDFIDQMHESLEQHIHQTLKHVTEQIETDLKRALNEQIAKLRKQF